MRLVLDLVVCLLLSSCIIATDATVKNGLEDDIKAALATYEKNERSFTPTIVEVGITVLSFSSISVIDMDYTLNVEMKMRWKDKRFLLVDYTTLYNALHIKESIWRPDIYFKNLKDAKLHSIPVPNVMLSLNTSQGVFTLTQTFSLKLSCDMNLWNFPFDIQHCSIDMGSYFYEDRDLQLRWWNKNRKYSDESYFEMKNHSAVELHPTLIINEFERPVTGYCLKSERRNHGERTYLRALFRLERKFGFYITYVYLPSLMVLFVCWLSFFIDYKSAPARISICVFCILSIISQGNSVINTLPKVSYSKAIDWWILSCFTLVILSFLEYVLVNYSYRNEKIFWMRFKFNIAYRIDRLSIIVFPMIVMTFNICYWGYYLTTREYSETPCNPTQTRILM